MKIASWNVNSLNVRLPHLQHWLAASAPDVVALQETKLEDSRFPDTALAELGYRSVFAGQKTYNGVAILSREPSPATCSIGDSAVSRTAEARARRDRGRRAHRQPVRGQRPGRRHRQVRLQAALAGRRCTNGCARSCARIRTWWCSAISTSPRTIATCTTRCVWNDDHILTSTAEREALQRLLDARPARRLPPAPRRRRRSSAGGTTARPAFRATSACAST